MARALLFAAAVLVIAAGRWGAREADADERSTPWPGKTYSWTFEADTLGQAAAHARVFGGVWKVMADSADSARSIGAVQPADSTHAVKRLIQQCEDDDGVAFHYLIFTRPFLADLDASVRFRIVSGEIDPTAGLLFQMDPKGTSGYLVRVSGRTNELVFHYLLSGKRRDVRIAKIDPLEPNTWHKISISRRKSVLRASYDGKELMMVRDERFSNGMVGLWTGDDTIADFADLAATAR